MSTKKCDHTSVGMLVWKDGKLLLIERMKYPFGFAPPAGHVDGDSSFEESAERELKEEVGLDTASLKLVWEGRKENTCRREDGTWHYWRIYKTEATGELSRSLDETKQAGWYSKEDIDALMERTGEYLDGLVKDEDWQQDPGLETFWQGFFMETEILENRESRLEIDLTRNQEKPFEEFR